jgi:hypothetical protein
VKPEPAKIETTPPEPEKAQAAAAGAPSPGRYTPKTSVPDRNYPTLGYE